MKKNSKNICIYTIEKRYIHLVHLQTIKYCSNSLQISSIGLETLTVLFQLNLSNSQSKNSRKILVKCKGGGGGGGTTGNFSKIQKQLKKPSN